MGAIGRLKAGFGSAVAATTLLAAPAFTQEAPEPTRVALLSRDASSIQFLEDANFAASSWVVHGEDRFAATIRYGGATDYAPQQIQDVLERDLRANGIENAVFFWEHGPTDSGTSILFETDGNAFGPFGLGTVRQEIPEIARQINFDRRIGLAAAMN